MKIRRILFSDQFRYMRKLLEKHAAEIVPLSLGHKTQLDIDEKYYIELEKADKSIILGLFDRDTIVGYLSIFVYNHHHHKKTMFAITDAFYILPEYRGQKMMSELFDVAEKMLKYQYNVKYLYMGVSALKDLKKLAVAMHYWPADVLYIKELE